MQCSSCQHENAGGASFCEECGARLERRCPSCDAACGPTAKFCSSCGASLAARPPPPRPEAVGGRKVVTILFSDLIGSVALQERLDPESASRVMERYHRLVRAEVEAEGGSLVQLIGDGVMCAFGVPQLAEDDALRAVRAAVAVQRAFREFAGEESARVGRLGLRIAVNTGEVVPSVDLPAGIGDPLNVAARLQQEAKDGDVVIGEATERIVRDKVTLERLGVFSLKGRTETVAAYRVVSLERPAGIAATPFVGREHELERLTAVYESTVADRRARLAVILGSPGLGKSRLIDELGRRVGEDATVLAAHCDLTRGATFAPIAKTLRAHLGIDDAAGTDATRAAVAAAAKGDDGERARIADGIAALLAGTPASPEETFFVVRRFLVGLAAERPVVLAIDDLQWAETLLLDLLEHLVQWTTDVPLVVLVAARPELRESRSSFATTGGFVSEVVTLAGLDAAAATRLAANVIGADQLPAAVAGRVLATSEGNPLFVGELVRMLVSEGALKLEGERWTASAELAKLEMPPTIQALLAARIERLRPEERMVLERAAVVGRQFSRAAVTHLLPREIADLDARLEALRRSELIEPDSGWLLGEPVLRFHHVLIRDAAYRRLLKNTRAELHERFADWLTGRAGGAVEHDETIGWHLEQAHRNLGELGPLDEHGRALGERASRHLAAAGRRALAREDLPLAGNLLGRALDRLDPGDSARADLALDWCEALLAAADVGAAVRAVEELGRFTAGSDRLEAWHTCFSSQLAVFTDPKNLRATASAVAAAAERLAAAGDAAGEAKGHYVNAMALTRLGKIGACEAALDRALAAARRAGDRRRSNAVLAGAPVAALWGPSPVTRASGRCLDVVRVLRITEGAPGVEAVALRCQGVLEALRGRTDAARRMIATARRMVEELGITHQLLEADVFAGLIEFLEGDAASAERSLRTAYEGLRDQGLGIDAARAAALLGRALLALDRAAEAETLSHESEALAGDDLKAASAWRAVRAEALARRGEHAAAVELARAAVEIAAATDALLDHADARLALAAALRAAGKGAEASAEEARAIELWEAKGATLLAERARREVPPAAGAVQPPAEPPVRELTSAPTRAVPPKRRVRSNAASVSAIRLDAAIAAGDAEMVARLHGEKFESVDHPTMAIYDRQGALFSARSLMSARDAVHRSEPLAILGDSLALCRVTMSASGAAGAKFDVGEYELEKIYLLEVDAEERFLRAEAFAVDHLDDAVARLYERHSELLPDGHERDRAAATAASVAVIVKRDLDRYPSVIAADARFSDRRVLGMGTARGAKTFIDGMRSLLELADNLVFRIDDILDLRPDALLTRETNSGRLREGGGAFDRHFIQRLVFGEDGLLASGELLDADHVEEALERFDQPRARPAAEGSKRRVRRNAAIEMTAALDAVVASQDLRPLEDLSAEDLEYVDHVNHLTYGREEAGRNFEALMGAQSLVVTHEPLASLGDVLALFNRRVTARSGSAARRFDVGPWEHDSSLLIETDSHGKARRVDVFAQDRLGAALARFYERYAELLPEGAERGRAAATARSIATLVGEPYDADRVPTTWAPDIEAVDHRRFGFGATRGAEAYHKFFRSLIDASESFTIRVDDVLAARADALLLRRTNHGKDRTSGGVYERAFCSLWLFGADGLVFRYEQFDVGREDQALARFDELTAPKPKRRVRPNAATKVVARLDAAMAARDVEALKALSVGDVSVIEHPTGTTYDGAANLASRLMLLRAENLKFAHETLATLDESLGLFRLSIEASGASGKTWDVGPYEREIFILADTRGARSEMFATDRLGAAVARMYAWHAELLPEGAGRARAEATARTVAVLVGPLDDWHALAFARDVEGFDHRPVIGQGRWRSREGMQRVIRVFRDVETVTGYAIEDVFAVSSEVLLLRARTSGEVGHGGGAYERELLQLYVFGTDGLVTRFEQFDPCQADEALARLDELTAAQSRTVAKPPRRVQSNGATANLACLDAALAAGDTDALPALLSEDVRAVEYISGTVFDRQELLVRFHQMAKSPGAKHRHEPLATLGDSLGLFHLFSSASGESDEKLDIGPYTWEELVLLEVDPRGRTRLGETFATNRLGDAIVRLYERYAQLVPEGPERVRAAKIARSLAPNVGKLDFDRVSATVARDLELVDHRTLGSWSARGSEEVAKHWRSWLELGEDAECTIDDILAARPDAMVVRRTGSGIDRSGGGIYEVQFLALMMFGADGLITRNEMFDFDSDAEALARFDELTAKPRFAAAKPARRVHPNAATANVARLDATIAARDANGLAALYADEMQVVNHMLAGGIYGREGALKTWQTLLAAQDPTCRHEPLATLGDSLALSRQILSGSSFTGARFDVGAYEREAISLVEVDANGLQQQAEFFAADRLNDAIVRLYERYAELVPAGAERERAATVARSVAVIWGPVNQQAGRLELDPSLETVDHRLLGTWSSLGAEGFLQNLSAWSEVGDSVGLRIEGILALRIDALLWRGATFGTDRSGGGTFERPYLLLWCFGVDGRVTRIEFFDADREAEAFSRFDELTARPAAAVPAPRRRVRPNAATALGDRAAAAILAGRPDALRELFSDAFEMVDHIHGARLDRGESLLWMHYSMEDRKLGVRHEPLATLGDSLVVSRWSMSAIGDAKFDVGPYENDMIVLSEVDERGRSGRAEAFAADRLGDAIARLYERHAELLPDGPEHARAANIARSIATNSGKVDFDRYPTTIARDVEFVDHRTLGSWSAHGAEEVAKHWRSQAELSEGFAVRMEDILALRRDSMVGRWTGSGIARTGGGIYENQFLALVVFGPDGLTIRNEIFEPGCEADALARFDELVGDRAVPSAPKRRVRRNEATVNSDRIEAVMATGHFEIMPELYSDDTELVDHIHGALLDREGVLLRARFGMEGRGLRIRNEPLATLGNSLALCRWSSSANAAADTSLDVGPYEIDGIVLGEVDERGRNRRSEVFAADRLGEAIVRLYQRYAEILPTGPERNRAATTVRAVAAFMLPLDDLDARIVAAAPDIAIDDRRRVVGLGRARGREALRKGLRTVVEAGESLALRIDDILALEPDALIVRFTICGIDRRSGGAFELVFLGLWIFGSDGLVTRFEQFDADCIDEAFVRLDELMAKPVVVCATRRVRPNGSTEHVARLDAAVAARDVELAATLLAEDMEVVDHTTGSVSDREGQLSHLPALLTHARDLKYHHEALATLGESLGLFRFSLTASGVAGKRFDVGAYDLEKINLVEVDDHGRACRVEDFAPERLNAAGLRLYERYAELLPEGPARERALATARSIRVLDGPLDAERYWEVIRPEFEFKDHRRFGLEAQQGVDAYLRRTRSLYELADDIEYHFEDLLALGPNAFLGRWTNSGTERVGGGAFEREFLGLWVFGADGRAIRQELFETDCVVEALARFDELIEATPHHPALRAGLSLPGRSKERRVRPNAATVNAARLDAVVAAGDADALPGLFAEDIENVEHTTGTVFDRQGVLLTFRRLLSRRFSRWDHEPLATLGELLALFRHSIIGPGTADRAFDIGPFDNEKIVVVECDSLGRARRAESFAAEHLGDAVVRLYERYAELLPEGPERACVAGTARSIAAMLGPLDVDRRAAVLDSSFEHVDHQTLGTWSARGAQANLQNLRSYQEVAESITFRLDDVLAVRPNALLGHWTSSGTNRAGAGAFEWPHLAIYQFGADGRCTRGEAFDSDRDAEALARFDELTAPRSPARKPERQVRPNAATAFAARADAAVAARDIESWPSLVSADYRVVEHLVGLESDRDGTVRSFRVMLSNPNVSFRHEPLATLGDSLALLLLSISATGGSGDFAEAGPFEIERVVLNETNAEGLCRRSELFAGDRLGEGIARLYEWYADSITDAASRERATMTARAVGFMLIEGRADDPKTLFEPNYQDVDHRLVGHGAVSPQEMTKAVLSLHQVADGLRYRVDDVLALAPHALLRTTTSFGVWREGGGSFERTFLALTTFGPDGRIARHEKFDLGHEAEALARLDELAVEALPPPRSLRRVEANAATVQAAKLDAAVAAKDADAFPSLFVHDSQAVDHTTGTTWGRQGAVSSFGALMKAQNPRSLHEPLATLGSSLGLFRVSSSASGFSGGNFDVGSYEREQIILSEVDDQGRNVKGEVFASDRLGDAIARLYESYAEQLSEAPERKRCSAIANHIGAMLGPFDADRWAAAASPTMELVDHRTLGTWSARGVEANLQHWKALLEVVNEVSCRIDDVLALRADAIVVRHTSSGTARDSGGAFEISHLILIRFGADGRYAWVEAFDCSREAEALARFDELTKRERRVRPNAFTANEERIDAAFAARNADALPQALSDVCEFVDHATGTVIDREGVLKTFRVLLGRRVLTNHREPLATLGDSLGLSRLLVSGSGAVDGDFDVGPYDIEKIHLGEVDSQGRTRRVEAFAHDRLDEAIVRLYERYAELLPEGPARERATATARAARRFLELFDPDLASALDPEIDYVDHRAVGIGSVHGATAYLDWLHSLGEVAEGVSFHIEDVLDLRPDAILGRLTNRGTARAGGGRFERHLLTILLHGADGRVTRIEHFDVDDERAALARFDELTAPPSEAAKPKRRVRPNTTTVSAERLDAAIAAGDAAALESLIGDDCENIDHPTGRVIDRRGIMLWLRMGLDHQIQENRREPLATLGDSLGLFRISSSGEGMLGGDLDVGPWEMQRISVTECDIHCRARRLEFFDVDRLGSAVVRLYERYAELLPEGPAREKATATARSVANTMGPIDIDQFAAVFDPSVVGVDHRTLGTWASCGIDEFLGHLRAYLQVAESPTIRADDVLALRLDALLVRAATFGIDRAGGGRFERPYLLLACFGTDGRITRYEQFNVDDEDTALTRFDELTCKWLGRQIENAATRANDRFDDAWRTGDWRAIESLFAPDLRVMDHRPYAHLELDRGQQIESLRTRFGMSSSRVESEILATRGDRLVLGRAQYEVADHDVGPSVTGSSVYVSEVDEQGRVRFVVVFSPDDLDAAYAELEARFDAGEAATHHRAGRTFEKARAARDWETAAAQLAPDFVLIDHRFPGLGTIRGAAEYIDSIRALVALAPDQRTRIEHVALSRGAALVVLSSDGTWHGGVFETRGIVVGELDALDRIRRFDFYDYDRFEEANARFAAIRFDPLQVPANAATVAVDRHAEALKARDSTALDALCAPTVEYADRRRIVRLEGGRDMLIASSRLIGEAGVRMEKTSLVIAGERLALQHIRWSGEAPEFEAENLALTEVDAEGRIVAVLSFDPDDRRAASAELLERFARGEGARPGVSHLIELSRAFFAHDLDRARAVLPPDFSWLDHRRTGAGELDREGFVGWQKALFEQSPDAYIELVYAVAASEEGMLGVVRGLGTLVDGGPFEFVNATLWRFRGGELAGAEVFELDDLDAARARFDALAAESGKSE